MTRGTLYCITDKEVIQTTEYNGDAYIEGYGIFYIHLLEKTRNADDFIQMVQAFQNHYFNGYNDSETFYYEKRKKFFNKNGQLPLNDGKYFDYFSDWMFFKNVSSEPFGIITYDGDLKILNVGEQIALNYGHTKGAYMNVKECRKVGGMGDGDWGLVDDDFKRKIIIEASGQEHSE